MTVEELQEVLGENALLALFQHFGGQRLYVPARIRPQHKIARVLGMEAAQRLQEQYGGQIVTLPLGRCYVLQERDREICRLRREGWSVAALALRFHVTHRWMQRILKKNGCKVAS